MDKSLRQMAAGSLEIETGTQEVDFDAMCIIFCIFLNYYTLIV
jgi:hypothetical protein